MPKKQTQLSPEKRVAQFIREKQLIPLSGKLVVAVSGGTDSICLLHILNNLSEELDIKLHVAHLDHRLRGAESEADAVYVASLAAQLKLAVTVGACDVRAYRALHHLSLEEAAREVRYNFLSKVARSFGTDLVAVGHTDDDQVETILLHIIRGTGIRGLRGLEATSPWRSAGHKVNIIRPLLAMSRQETVEYCREHRLKPRLDSSNRSLSPLRNKVRQQLIPLLTSYNPGIKEALLRMARLAGDDLALLEKKDSKLAGLIRKHGGAVIIERQPFLDLPVSLKRQLLRTAVGGLLGTLKDIEARHINGIIGAADKPAGKRLSLPGGLVFINEYDRYVLSPESNLPDTLPAIEGEFSLKIPGETRFPGWTVLADIINPEEMGDIGDGFTACLSLDKVGKKLSVRARHPGDAIQPLGMKHPKELAEFMIDAKIPRALRSRIPLVCSPEQIDWVVGWRIDERAKVTRETKKVLRLEFKQDEV